MKKLETVTIMKKLETVAIANEKHPKQMKLVSISRDLAVHPTTHNSICQ